MLAVAPYWPATLSSSKKRRLEATVRYLRESSALVQAPSKRPHLPYCRHSNNLKTHNRPSPTTYCYLDRNVKFTPADPGPSKMIFPLLQILPQRPERQRHHFGQPNMAFWHLFLGLLISTISLIASIIFLTTTTSDRLRYFYVAWTTVSAALVWILVCVSVCLWTRRCEGAMKVEPRKERIGRTVFEVCWPNGSQGSFHSFHRDRPQAQVPAPAKRTSTASPESSPFQLESGKSKHNRTSSHIPFPPTVYSHSRYPPTPSDSSASGNSSNSRIALIYPDSHGFFHDPDLTKPRSPAPPKKHPWCIGGRPSLTYPDSTNDIYHSPTQGPNVSPLSQSPLNRQSAVSALSLDTTSHKQSWRQRA
ncbi:hypothetical protein AC579_4598 [Pseudocercospora musae]|uniref:Uncharacterized protein n=1 Tax=Pseudocercospora musae TaxID=113226 RepID=A0A139ITV9_9PEZI|nr:hypothetical protein AC579_4598 [Pseudocercospora musae]